MTVKSNMFEISSCDTMTDRPFIGLILVYIPNYKMEYEGNLSEYIKKDVNIHREISRKSF